MYLDLITLFLCVISHLLLHQGLTTFLHSLEEDSSVLLCQYWQKQSGQKNKVICMKKCSQGSIIFSRCALKGGPPINNDFSFAVQTCPEKFQGFQYEDSFKNHRNHIAFESANVCGVQCWRKQQVSECFISYQWSGFVNEKFRSNCVILNSDYHKEEMHRTCQWSSFDYFNGNMLELGKPSPRRK